MTSSDSSRAVPKVVSTVYDPEDELHSAHYDEPYFGGGGGMNGIATGDNLTVGPRMELVVSEGEDDEEDDDVVVMKPAITNSREDSTKQDVEKVCHTGVLIDPSLTPFSSCLRVFLSLGPHDLYRDVSLRRPSFYTLSFVFVRFRLHHWMSIQ